MYAHPTGSSTRQGWWTDASSLQKKRERYICISIHSVGTCCTVRQSQETRGAGPYAVCICRQILSMCTITHKRISCYTHVQVLSSHPLPSGQIATAVCPLSLSHAAGLSKGVLAVLHRQLSQQREVAVTTLRERWRDAGCSDAKLNELLT